METRASKRRRLNESLNVRYRWFPKSLAYIRWRLFHYATHVDDYDFRIWSGYETVWAAMCQPVEDSLESDLTYVQIAQLSLPASLRFPQLH